MNKTLHYWILLAAVLLTRGLCAQEGRVIDQVVAVVGGNIILESDVEVQFMQYRMQQGITGSATTVRCGILENMLYQKLLLNQAELDSVEVADNQVESELDRRLRYFISQFGSQEKFEEFYDKSVVEFKEEFREQIREQIMVERVQEDITTDTRITPSEVRAFYKNIPQDSLPYINSEVEVSQIVRIPPVSSDERSRVRTKLNELRNRVLEGENFSTLAILYSEDAESARNGGEIGLVGRGELFPEFEAVAFKLKKDEVSEIVETQAGFHILQLIERRGEYVNVRHILLVPKVSPQDLAKAKSELDSIAGLIERKEMTFEEAVSRFSDDPGKISGGVLINPITGTTLFEVDQLDPKVFFVVDKLGVGEMSSAVPMKTEDGRDTYRILRLNRRTEPHLANLNDDYDRIQTWALEEKKSRIISDWISEKAANTYIKINGEYAGCSFTNEWVVR